MHTEVAKFVCYRHEDFLVLNKPSGWSCHNDANSLSERLGPEWHLVHRLDRETSGLLMITAKPELQQNLQTALAQGEKKYRAILRGALSVTADFQEWNWPITDRAEGREHPQGDPAQQVSSKTLYRCLKASTYFSYVECILKTGRQHQIRKHACLFGKVIVGDQRYGSIKDNERIQKMYDFHRLALHAFSLQFTWKQTAVSVFADVPEEFQKILSKI